MLVFILMLILSAGLQIDGSVLDDAFDNFLSSHPTSKSYEDYSVAVKNLYTLYRNEHKRPSITSAEDNLRYSSFNDTVLNLLKDHQQGDKTYTVGLNQYADWTPDELNGLLGVQHPQGKIIDTNAEPNERLLGLDGQEIQSKTATITLPASLDYTTLVVGGTHTPFLTSIKNQGVCESCYAFAFVALLEVQYAVQLKTTGILSEQQMIDCSVNDGDNGCSKGYITNTFGYLQRNSNQVRSLASYPYIAQAGTCRFSTTSAAGGVIFSTLRYQLLPNNANAIQQALYTYGPLWVTLFVGDPSISAYQNIYSIFSSYTGGVLKFTGCPTELTTTNHAVVIVGYGVDANTGLQYWKVRNSWGVNWGEQGYFLIQRGVNMCGIESGAYYIAKST